MPRSVTLLLYVAIASLGDALAPTRRAALRSAVGALSLTTAQRAVAATNAEAEKVRVASRELNELLKNEDALRFKVLVEGSGKLPIAVSFITFQKLEKDCGDDFMGAAIEYAETYKDAKDLVKLASPGVRARHRRVRRDAPTPRAGGAQQRRRRRPGRRDAVLRARAAEPQGGVREARRRRQAAAEVGVCCVKVK